MILRDLEITVERNPVVHVFSANGRQQPLTLGRCTATEVISEAGQHGIILRSRKKSGYGNYDAVFLDMPSKTRCTQSLLTIDSAHESQLQAIRDTWTVSLPLLQSAGGFRDAQRGALLAIFSHWTRSDLPATVVMPTGTGKTETLLATIATLASGCVLVIVPTDPLRSQFFNKAITWGKLRSLGVLGEHSLYPVVGMLRYGMKSVGSLCAFLDRCQIVVATMPILSAMPSEQLKEFSTRCNVLAVDEAHHLSAPSWARVVEDFSDSKILQFTATPFRQDGKHIGGEIIYTYPLGRCQKEGFFRPIEFLAVTEFFDERADAAICDVAVARLRQDIANGFDHALMARTCSKERARKVFSLYRDEHPDLNPVIIYSGLPVAAKEAAKSALLTGRSKIVVCVDMLGEGFDYPPLKVAAIHDSHKSLPITLQFIGRFTRSGNHTIGNASVVTNIADPKMQANVSSLYSQDADWDKIIRGSYENAVGHEIEFQRFVNGFAFDGIRGFSLRNIKPKFSAFVYSVSSDVGFDRLKTQYNDGSHFRLAINEADAVAVIIHKEDMGVEWGHVVELENTNYHCYCLYYDSDHGLLFVFASAGDIPDHLAAVVATTAIRIADRNIHRCLHGINRLMLSNVGLRRRLVGPIRYRHYIGLDVGQGLAERIQENTYTALLFGSGYEDGQRANVGCSLKGKIWSRNAGSLIDWTRWCFHVGGKIVDNSIDVDGILEGVLFPEEITELPADRIVVHADWSDFFFENMYERTVVYVAGEEISIEECSIALDARATDRATIMFALEHGVSRTAYVLALTKSVPEGYTITCCSAMDCAVKMGREQIQGADFFAKHPPMFWLDDSSVIADGCLLVRASRAQTAVVYDISNLVSRDWTGVDIQLESQGEDRRIDSIQHAMIEEVCGEDGALFVFDDHGAGEVADIIAAYERADVLVVKLWHCKCSSESRPGCRVSEVYELCGQAQKSVKWAGSTQLFIEHLKHREQLRIGRGGKSRFELGSLESLVRFRGLSRQKRLRFEVVLVQPGLSKAALLSTSEATGGIPRILGATAAYLAETFEMKMEVVLSP